MHTNNESAEVASRSIRHYLQSDSWLNLRTDYQKVEGIFYEFPNVSYMSLVAHLPVERTRRSFIRTTVLEFYFGPSSESLSISPYLDSRVYEQIAQIARLHGAKKIRFHGYLSTDFGYVTLNEYSEVLQKARDPFTLHPSSTWIYDLAEHKYNSLDGCESSVRKNLRKASDIRIVKVTTPDQIRDFLLQHALIKGRGEPKLHEIRAYQDWQDGCVLMLAYNSIDNRCLGTLGFVHDNYLATEIASSSAKGPESRGVQKKLHLTGFDEAKKLGLKKFDLAGLERDSDGNWNSIAKFKMKFVGELVDTGYIEVDLRKIRKISST
jgi:hypothetical protein